MSEPDPTPPAAPLLRTPLYELHRELGARMVPFAGYSMPVQYPSGLIAEHLHTRAAAGLFDVSHMGQLRLLGAGAATAFESLVPMDVLDLAPGRQRYGLLLNEGGGIRDDLMFIKRHGAGGEEIFVIVNGACKEADIAYLRERIGARCEIVPCPDQALLALQGPRAAPVLQALAPDVGTLRFMTGAAFGLRCGVTGAQREVPCFVTRSGYTGEDGFEISVPSEHAELLARTLLAQADVKPVGLGARNSLRLEAGLCLYGNDLDAGTTPAQAGLGWAIQKVRRSGGARAGGFPGAERVLAELDDESSVPRRRVGLLARERIPVREPAPLHDAAGRAVGQVTSGLIGPSMQQPIAMGYVAREASALGTRLDAQVRGKPVPMEVVAMPFVPHRYFRG